MDKTTKIIMAAIAAGLFLNVATTLMPKRASAEENYSSVLHSIDDRLSSIQSYADLIALNNPQLPKAAAAKPKVSAHRVLVSGQRPVHGRVVAFSKRRPHVAGHPLNQ
jgi:hypothetical protein